MLSTGTDIIHLPRMEQAVQTYGDKFIERIFTPAEIAHCRGRVGPLAVRFAAKEAIAKALGVGMRIMSRHGIHWHDAEIINDAKGRPMVVLHGRAAELAAAQGLTHWSISLSHEREYGVAFVVAISPVTIYAHV